MKAIIVAALVTAVVAGAVTIAFRWATTRRQAAVMVRISLGFVPVLVLVWGATPDDLGFLPPTVLAEPQWFDLTACLFFYTAAFCGGLLQLYNLAERGLSLRILAELRSSDRPMTVDEIAEGYSEGRGLAWMYDKRLEGLTQHGLVVVDGEEVRLTARGRLWARRFARLRRFLRVPVP